MEVEIPMEAETLMKVETPTQEVSLHIENLVFEDGCQSGLSSQSGKMFL